MRFFIPPKKVTVSQWADENRVLTREESPTAGLWNTDNTPYLRAIMDAFTDDHTELISFLKPTQVGATEMMINICGYTIDSSPCRILYVLPDEESARDFSVDRLQKALRNTPSIKQKMGKADKSKALVLRYPGGFIRLTGAQSPAKLASWPIPRAILDEVDKYPRWTAKEASPVSLIKERTKNWPWRKIFVASTPTTEQGYIYRAYAEAEAHYEYQVPCPHCGHMQPLVWKQLVFDSQKTGESLAKSTYYECVMCKGKIHDKHKMPMLQKGKWVSLEKQGQPPKTVGFKLSSLYSPWVTFSDMAREFIKSKDDPSKLMNFVNSWLGEPWKSKASQIKSKSVFEHKTEYPLGVVPPNTVALVGGVDCQKGYNYWVVRAIQENMTSQLVAYGTAPTLDDVGNIMDQYWPIDGFEGEGLQVMAYGVDSGFNTQAVYDFCASRAPVAIPVKGASGDMQSRFRITQLKPGQGSRYGGMGQQLYVLDTNQYKDQIAYRLNKSVDEVGAWNIASDTEQVYADMITSEQKVLVDNREVWQPITSSRDNHYLDCEVYVLAVADILGVRYYRTPVRAMQKSAQTGYNEQPKSDNIIPEYYDPFG